MTVRAEFQKNYLMRYAALAAVCLLMAAWFGYDGLVGYPQKLVYARAYDELRSLDSTQRIDKWKKLAAENNWPKDVPTKTAEEVESDITGQYFWGGLNLLVGLPALFLLLRSRGSWVQGTDGGLTTSWGQTLRYADVKSLDKRKWQRKGIAKATYIESVAGGPENVSRTFVFDDFKFDREPLGKMLSELESHLSPEQITGGEPENATSKA